MSDTRTGGRRPAVASIPDRIAFVAEVVAPTLAKGPLIRRPRAVATAERLGLDTRAVRRMERLRERYGPGPLLVPVPGRLHCVVLSPAHVRTVLAGTPEPFSPASTEKRLALAHFEPDVSLISTGAERQASRRFSEAVLDSGRPVHGLAQRFLEVVEEEAGRLLAAAGERLDWDTFIRSWYAAVRRIVLGDGARDDEALTDLLARIRARGNLVVLRQRSDLLRQVHDAIDRHIRRADPGSLAARIADLPKTGREEPADQVAHFLFAFDPGGMATLRALALLAAHPDALARVRSEAAGNGPEDERGLMPYTRAIFLESLRLWPTTPVILRETSGRTKLDGAELPVGTHVIIFAPYFHRNGRLPFAHAFAPDIWLSEGDDAPSLYEAAEGRFALVPFSYGPGRCPASELVPMLGSRFLAAIVAARTPALEDGGLLRADAPMPGTLNNYRLAFRLSPAGA